MLTVDYTTLRAVASCSTQAAMTSVLALQPTGTRLPLEAGIGAHAALAVWLETGSAAQALSAFEAHYRPCWQRAVAAHEVKPEHEERLHVTTVRAILTHWFREHAGGEFPYQLEPGMTEIAVTRNLGEIGDEPVQYVALIDAVVRSRAGGRWFCDHKTTGGSLGPWWVEEQHVSGQFVGQRWAGEGYDVEGIVVNGIQFRKLNTSPKRCPVHAVSYAECALQHCDARLATVTVTPQMAADYGAVVTRLVRKLQRIRRQVSSIEDVKNQPKEGWLTGACNRCDYRVWCHGGRATRGVTRLFEHRVWDPLAEARARRVRRDEGQGKGASA